MNAEAAVFCEEILEGTRVREHRAGVRGTRRKDEWKRGIVPRARTESDAELRWQFPLGFISWKPSTGYTWYGLEGDERMEFMTQGALLFLDGLGIVRDRHPDELVPITTAVFESFFEDLEPFPHVYGYYYEQFSEPFMAPDGRCFKTLGALRHHVG